MRATSSCLLLLASLGAVACHRHKHPQGPQDVPASAMTGQQAQPGQPPAPSFAATGGAVLEHVTTGDEDETFPALSPDGHLLLFQATTNVQDANGNAVKQETIVGVDPSAAAARSIFTTANTHAETPSWMPDGHGFVYLSDSTGSWAVVRTLAAAPNAAVTVIAGSNVAHNPALPRVSPSGRYVAFTTTVRDVETIAVVGIEGSRLTMLGPGSIPSFSPDDKRLVFIRPVNGVQQIFLVDAHTGGNLAQLTSDGTNHYAPSFSPDGRYVVYVAADQQSGAVYAMHPDGTGVVQLTTGPGYLSSPFWGRDGWVYFALDLTGSGNHDIWRLKPTGELSGGAPSTAPLPSAAQTLPVTPGTAPAGTTLPTVPATQSARTPPTPPAHTAPTAPGPRKAP